MDLTNVKCIKMKLKLRKPTFKVGGDFLAKKLLD